jgi:transcriptional regulator with XRE-family HTH domain
MPDARAQFSELVRNKRAELRLTVRELADRSFDDITDTQVRPSWLSKVERGAEDLGAPKEGQLRALAAGLGLPLPILQDAAAAQFFGVETVRDEDTEARAMLLQIEGMSPEDRAKVRALLDAWGPSVANNGR